MSDLVKRLRGFVVDDRHYGKCLTMSIQASDVDEAAATIEAQAAEIERLREAAKGSLVIVNAAVDARKQAESALAKAVEVMRPFATWIDAIDAFPTASFPDHASIEIGHETGDPQPTKITGAHLRAARAFIAEHGSDSREGK